MKKTVLKNKDYWTFLNFFVFKPVLLLELDTRKWWIVQSKCLVNILYCITVKAIYLLWWYIYCGGVFTASIWDGVALPCGSAMWGPKRCIILCCDIFAVVIYSLWWCICCMHLGWDFPSLLWRCVGAVGSPLLVYVFVGGAAWGLSVRPCSSIFSWVPWSPLRGEDARRL